MNDEMKNESLATKFVNNMYKVRVATNIIGFTLSIILIWLGYSLTQQDIINKKIVDSEISLETKTTKFALKNTAPGIVLILCGTIIAISTIRRKTYVKTQWSDQKNGIPGYTESKG